MKLRNLIIGIGSTLIVASTLALAVLPGITSAHGNHNEPCTGPHKNDDGCGSGGGGGGGGDAGAADPKFAYRRDGGSAAKIYLANADGSEATLVFTGVKFSRTGEPTVRGDANGGVLLIETFRNLHRIVYAVNNGVVSVVEDVKILDRGDDDSGLSILAPQPQWSPDGQDFVYKNGAVNPSGRNMHLYSRATSNPSTQAITDFGAPIYQGPKDESGEDWDIGWLAWDEADTIHFTIRDADRVGWELRSLSVSHCNSLSDGTCLHEDTTCIASTSSCGEPLGASTLSHVSVNYDDAVGGPCGGGTAPRILVAATTASGSEQTFLIEGDLVISNFQGISGHDWTTDCTILGTVEDRVVDFDPYGAGGASTLIPRGSSVPDWIN